MKNITNCIEQDMPIDTSALHLLHRAGQCADELFAGNIGGNELTPRQFEVLKAVSEHNEPSQTALVSHTGIDRSTLADIVRRLVDRGLLKRRRTAHDARKYAVQLTEVGRGIFEGAGPVVSMTNERLLAALPEECRIAFLSSLSRIIESLEAKEDSTALKPAA